MNFKKVKAIALRSTVVCLLIFEFSTSHCQKISSIYNFNSVNAAIVKEGDIWQGSDVGLVQRDVHTNEIKNYYNEANSKLISNRITCLSFKGTVLWVGTVDGISVFDGKTFQTIVEVTNRDHVRAIAHTASSETFIVTNEHLWEMVNGKMVKIELTRVIEQLSASGLTSMNDLWTFGYSSNCYPIFKKLKTQAGMADSLAGASPFFFSTTKNLFCASTNGMLSYSKGTWKRHSRLKANQGRVASFIREDRKGSIWFDAYNDVGKYEDGKVTWMSKDPRMPKDLSISIRNSMDLVFDLAGAPLLVLQDGVLNLHSMQLFKFPQLNFNSFIKSYWLSNDTLALITNAQVIKYCNGNIRVFPNDHGSSVYLDKISEMLPDEQGVIWTRVGQDLLRTKDNRTQEFNSGIRDRHSDELLADKRNRLWITNYDGLVMVDNKDSVNTVSDSKLSSNYFYTDFTQPYTYSNNTDIVFAFEDRMLEVEKMEIKKYGKRIPELNSVLYDKKERGYWLTGDSLYFFDGKALQSKNSIPIRKQAFWYKGPSLLFEFENEIWTFGKNNTIIKCGRKGTTVFGTKEGIGNFPVKFYTLLNERLIVWHSLGVSIYKKNKWMYYPLPAGFNTDQAERTMEEDKDGNIWIPSEFGKPGLLKFDGIKWQYLDMKSVGLPDQTFVTLIKSTNGVLSFFSSIGLFTLGTANQWLHNTENGKLDEMVNTISIDNTYVIAWLKEDTIGIYDGKTWKYVTNKNGLFSHHIYEMKKISPKAISLRHNSSYTILEF